MDLLGSPAMITAFVIVLLIEAASLLMLIINVQMFRTKAVKYRSLCRQLGQRDALWGTPGRFLIPAYSILTVMIVILTLAYFVWHPHFL